MHTAVQILELGHTVYSGSNTYSGYDIQLYVGGSAVASSWRITIARLSRRLLGRFQFGHVRSGELEPEQVDVFGNVLRVRGLGDNASDERAFLERLLYDEAQSHLGAGDLVL